MIKVIRMFAALNAISALNMFISVTSYAETASVLCYQVPSGCTDSSLPDADNEYKQHKGYSVKLDGWDTHIIYFVTNRKINWNAINIIPRNYESVFMGEGNAGFAVYGKLKVTVLKTKKIGEKAYPDIEIQQNSFLHTSISQLKFKINMGELLSDAKKYNKKSTISNNLLYIHGVKNTFPQSVRDLANFKVDINYQHSTFVYSWPSVGNSSWKIIKYNYDTATARYSEQDILKIR